MPCQTLPFLTALLADAHDVAYLQDKSLHELLIAGGTKADKARAPKSAVMLTEAIETEEGTMVKLHLWRRDILTGVCC